MPGWLASLEAKVKGQPGHPPPQRFGSPNGMFPMSNGDWLVTEINGDWVDEMTPAGKIVRPSRGRPRSGRPATWSAAVRPPARPLDSVITLRAG